MSNPINVSDYNPVDEDRKNALKKKFDLSKRTVIYTGRLAEEKRVDDIIRAISLVIKKFPDVNFAITGLGSGEEKLKKLVKELGLEKNVKFFGYVETSELPHYYQASEIFALMSTAETQSLSMMQAMATGIPVICANAWGPPEYVTPESGYIVEPKDYEGLAQKLIYLFENPNEMKRLGMGGIEHVKQFSATDVALKWEEIYQTELDRSSKGSQRLSFVIPAWNEEKYLKQSLESVVRESKKSGRDIEIIVVNNASTDRTREIALGFPEVKLVDEPRKGLPQARQAGFLVSSGDLIANMDADSILPPGWIEQAFEVFSRDEKIVALSGPYRFYDMPERINYIAKALFYLPGYFIHLFNHKVLRKAAMLQGGNFVLRRTALEKIGGFNVDIKFYGEDTDIARRIQKIGKVKFKRSFVMTTSGRRLKKEGFAIMVFRYIANHFWMIFFKKPFTEQYRHAGHLETRDNSLE